MIRMAVIRHARKEHICPYCDKPIPITEPHCYTFGGEEYGKPNGNRICKSCIMTEGQIIDEVVEFFKAEMLKFDQKASAKQLQISLKSAETMK